MVWYPMNRKTQTFIDVNSFHISLEIQCIIIKNFSCSFFCKFTICCENFTLNKSTSNDLAILKNNNKVGRLRQQYIKTYSYEVNSA